MTDIEKLKAIGWHPFNFNRLGPQDLEKRQRWLREPRPIQEHEPGSAEEFKAWAQSPEGLKATMADKVRWLRATYPGDSLVLDGSMSECRVEIVKDEGYDSAQTLLTAEADSPEAAVDALFWKVPR